MMHNNPMFGRNMVRPGGGMGGMMPMGGGGAPMGYGQQPGAYLHQQMAPASSQQMSYVATSPMVATLPQQQPIQQQQQQQQQQPIQQPIQQQPIQQQQQNSQPDISRSASGSIQTQQQSTRIVECSTDRKSTDGTVGIVFVDGVAPGRIGVLTLVNNGPAEQDGHVKVGDLISNVDGVNVIGWQLEDIRKLILGPTGTQVTMTFDRPQTGESFAVTLTRISAAQMESSSKALLERVRVAEAATMQEKLGRQKLEESNTTLKMQVKKLQDDLTTALTEAKRNETALIRSNDVISSLEEDLRYLKREVDRDKQNEETVIAALHHEAEEEQHAYREALNKIKILEETNTRLRQRHQEMEATVSSLQRENDEWRDQLERERDLRMRREAENVQLQQQLKKLSEKLDEEHRAREKEEDNNRPVEVKATLC